MRIDERTRRYVAKGKSKREIMRCLKRYVAREVYRASVDRPNPPVPVPVSVLDGPWEYRTVAVL